MPNLLRVIVPSAAAFLLGARAEASSLYTITDLGTLPGTSRSIATGINDLGQVVGYGNNASDGGFGPRYNPRPFLYSDGRLSPVSPVGGGAAEAINNAGLVVGGDNVAVNNSGQVAGPHFQVPFVTDSGTAQADFAPVGVNDAGQVAGTIFKPSGGGGMDAAIIRGGQVFDVARALKLDGEPTTAVAIDRAGDLLFNVYHPIGGSSAHPGTSTYMIYKADGSTQTLAFGGAATALNSSGQVVGSYQLFSDGQYTILTDLLTPDTRSLWSGLYPTAINDEGQIVGAGLVNGQTHAFLMTPTATPEPTPLALLAASIGIFSLRRRLRSGEGV